MSAKVLPIRPDDLPCIVASARLRVGERELRVAKLDDFGGMGPAIVFIGQPVHDILGGPDDEPFLLSYVQALDVDGQSVETFLADECFEHLVFHAGRCSNETPPGDVELNRESRAIVLGILNMFLGAAVS